MTSDFERIQRDRLADLRKAAAARPAHLDFLEILIDAAPGEILDDLRAPRGVSIQVARALIDDVEWIIASAPEPGMSPHQYPNAYAGLMLAWARATAKRNATREYNATWAGFSFGGK